MPSKTSKHPRIQPSLKRVELGCSEPRIQSLAAEAAALLRPGDRVLLEGEMGAGKSTFARCVLQALGSEKPSEGSPTFAIAHEYRTSRGDAIHADFYRLRSEAEIEQAGLSAYFWERNAIVLTEWLSLWPTFEKAVLKQLEDEPPRRILRVRLAFQATAADASLRDVEWELMQKLKHPSSNG